MLLLPKNIQQAVIGSGGPECRNGRHPGQPRIGDPHPLVRALRRARGPVTIIAGEQVARDDARVELELLRAVLRARIACVPDAKDVGGVPGLGSSSALGVTGVIGHPGAVDALAASALCLLVGTRLPVMARAGLDKVPSPARTYSIGSAAPYLPCTHLQTDDLRASLTQLTHALSGHGRPMGVRVPDVVPHTELAPPRCSDAGVRYRDAMAELDRACPAGRTSSSTRVIRVPQRSTTFRSAETGGSWSRSGWAAWGTASAPESGWHSPARGSAR